MKKIKDAFNDNSINVPFFQPYIDKVDEKIVNDALKLSLLTDGPKLQEFEKKFAKFTGAKYAIGVSNATSALQLSLNALRIGKGDEVIIPDMTFVATASAVLLTGATPIFVEVNESDMNISIKSIKKSITKKTKAILPVHFAGKICNIKEIKKIAMRKKLFVVEDCAHAIGAKLDKKHVGTFGNTGCFSFYPTKNITTIEGGMIITNSSLIAKYVKAARNHGITKSLKDRFAGGKPWDYDVLEPGYNYRLDEIRASLGTSQLKKLKKLNKLRKHAAMYYNSKLKNINGISLPEISNDSVYHLYIIKIKKDFGISRDNLFEKLSSLGIRTSVHYKPLHEFSIFQKKAKNYDSLKNTKKAYQEIMSLPFYPQITHKQQDFVINGIKKYSKNIS